MIKKARLGSFIDKKNFLKKNSKWPPNVMLKIRDFQAPYFATTYEFLQKTFTILKLMSPLDSKNVN